ncbi:MAG: M48 family metallopeptidase [Verrucomicrobiota bacterium]|jgi:STE24 endopeptidase|nr:M48 family metallopeptidase [Verrucomicrobiota bacterium]
MDWITPQGIAWIVGFMVILRGAAEWTLNRLNLSHLQAHRRQLPNGWKSVMDPSTYHRALDYTKTKGDLSQWSGLYETLLLWVFLFSGIMPFLQHQWTVVLGHSHWAQSGFLCFVATFLSLFHLPWNYYSQFYIEEQFGFNHASRRLWLVDQVKMFLLGWAIGWPVLTLLLLVVSKSGEQWWMWAWLVLLVFQVVMIILAPMFILPCFNKLSALQEGSLKTRLLHLAKHTGFGVRAIQVMDGSRRSGHSNAFFTGFGRFRRIVLYDTLVEQLTVEEVEGVLAHEIGHFRKRHVLSMLVLGMAGMLIQLFILALLAGQSFFYDAFGLPNEAISEAFLLFGLTFGTFTFWLSPLSNVLSRRFEYQADSFAIEATGNRDAFLSALRKINLENLSNPVPHSLFSFVYYSHPSLLEREKALASQIPSKD